MTTEGFLLTVSRYGINNFVYTARQPFHSRRLFSLLHDKFILLQNTEHDEEGEESEEGENGEDDQEDDDMESVEDFDQPEPATILANKRAHPAFGSVLRSKGFFWLATRPLQFGEWSQAGGMLTVGCGGPWFVELPRDMWPEDKDVYESIERDFQEPWGDRRQEIVFIGEGIDFDQITTCLNECLLDDEEMAQWEDIMENNKTSWDEKIELLGRMWEDGWESWPAFGIEDEDEDDMDLDKDKDGSKKHRISEHLAHGHSHSHNHGHGHAHVHKPMSLKRTAVA
jgi:hypothetical protein